MIRFHTRKLKVKPLTTCLIEQLSMQHVATHMLQLFFLHQTSILGKFSSKLKYDQ